MTTEVAIRATIDQIEGYRARALDLYAQSYDLEREAINALRLATPSTHEGSLPISEDRKYAARADWIEARRKEVDRLIWGHVIYSLGIERLMDRDAREQMRRTLQDNPPPATADNCHTWAQSLMADAGMIFQRGIANAFSRLDRRFRSHDGFKIGARLVLSWAMDSWGHWSRGQDETLRDVERAFHVLDKKPQPERHAGVVGACDQAKRGQGLSLRAFEAETEYFRVRGFKNGNLHLWFKRPDLVARVNELLADYYGATLGAGQDVAAKRHAPAQGLAKNYGFFESPEAVVARVIDEASIWTRERAQSLGALSVLEPSAGRGALARAAAQAGHLVTCVEVQSGLAAGLRDAGTYQRVICDDFLDVAPAGLGLFDRVIMNPPFDRGRDVDHVTHAMGFLAPGGRLVAVMSAGVEFREDAKTTDFRAEVERRGGRFLDLPHGSFAEAGTMVNTVLAIIPNPVRR